MYGVFDFVGEGGVVVYCVVLCYENVGFDLFVVVRVGVLVFVVVFGVVYLVVFG